MKYKLVNDNYTKNYAEQLIASYGASANILLNPDSSYLQSPHNFSKIDKAAELYLSSIENIDNNICIIIDPDVDGFTSSAIIWMYTKLISPEAKLHYKVHTGKQHGLEDMMDEIVEDDIKYSLIILPDSSSNDEEYHLELKDIGIPCLVLDHHIYDGNTFNAVIINNQLSPNYTNKDLTGAGVVYQFCRYIDEKLGINYADNFIDLAALGIISDMGSVLNYENRYIIKRGLEKTHKNFFFQTLIDKQAFSIGDNLNAIAISFYITPLINALIRVGTMDEKARLFEAFIDGTRKVPSTKRGEKGQLEMIATQMARTCTNARNHQNADKDKAVENLSIRIENEGLNQHQIIVVLLEEEDDFPSTLNGLIAM